VKEIFEAILDDYIDGYSEEMTSDLQKLLTFDTTKAAARQQAPFGAGIAAALQFVLQKADKWQLPCQNLEGYVGLIDYQTQVKPSQKQVGILCHIDTVPAGNAWTKEPFGGQISDGKIYGRGAVDDKGPLIACLYALRALKESNLPLNNKLRLIIGTDEESGFACMDYFLQHCPKPDFGFTPDAQFPLIYGEKGIVHFELSAKRGDEAGDIVIKKLHGGVSDNVIPDRAEAFLTLSPHGSFLLEEAYAKWSDHDHLLLMATDDGYNIKALGKTTHGSLPEKGRNAITLLLDFLNRLPVSGATGVFLKNCYELTGCDFDGSALGVYAEDQYGKTSMAPTSLLMDDRKITVGIDFRFPVTFKWQYFLERIKKTAVFYGLHLAVSEAKEPLFVPLDEPFVQDLLQSYRQITGDDSEPLVIGGGTYARVFDKFVGYGPVFPKQEQLAHQADEYLSQKDLIRLSKIYVQAMYVLSK
jgi:succinyl-diaminopimelate desuccinylase